MARPPLSSAPRNRQISISISVPEEQEILAVWQASGVAKSQFLRDVILNGIRSLQSNRKPTQSLSNSETTEFANANAQQHTKLTQSKVKQIQQDEDTRRTRADARSILNLSKKGVSSSLRSSQAKVPVSEADPEADDLETDLRDDEVELEPIAPSKPQEKTPEPVDDDDDSPWKQPELLKLTIVLSSGETVTNTWVFANACKMAPNDLTRIMTTDFLRPFKKAAIRCFAHSLRNTYRMKWCSAFNRRQNMWKDTLRSNTSFMAAAEFWIQEFISRGMTASQYVDACDEMRPKSLKFITCDMLANAIGSRVASWIPPEQRTHDKSNRSQVDDQGTQWVTLPGEGEPFMVIRSAADRARLLKLNKIT